MLKYKDNILLLISWYFEIYAQGPYTLYFPSFWKDSKKFLIIIRNVLIILGLYL